MHFIQPTQIWLSFRAKNMRVTSHETLLLSFKHFILGLFHYISKKFEHFYTQPLEKSQLTILWIEAGVPINLQKKIF